jgi:disulfide bond formation protein DsbB
MDTFERLVKKFDYLGLNLVLAAACADALILAYISEYGFDLKPCILCIYQRIPYAVGALLGIIAFVFFRKKRKALCVCALLLVGCFFVDAGIAAFHSGVEYGWWKGTDDCGAGGTPDSMEALRAQLMHAATVRCDEPQFTFLGISMAGYNFFYALGFALLGAQALRVLRREGAGR